MDRANHAYGIAQRREKKLETFCAKIGCALSTENVTNWLAVQCGWKMSWLISPGTDNRARRNF
jgi:hypothetical protein